ncbi:MAG: DsrE/DsrF/DrsH-like family protein [Polyangiaceae bacterium]
MEPEPISAAPITPLVDCRGLICPAPILKIAETLRRYKGNVATLTVLATDPEFAEDVEAWCRASHADLVRLTHQPDGVIRALIRVGAVSSRSAVVPPEPPASLRSAGERPLENAITVPPVTAPATPRSKAWSERLVGSHEAGAAALRLASDRPAFRGPTLRSVRPKQLEVVQMQMQAQAQAQAHQEEEMPPTAPQPRLSPTPAVRTSPTPQPASGPREVLEPRPGFVPPIVPLPAVVDSMPPSLPTNMHRLVRTPSDHAALIPDTPRRSWDGLAESPLPRENRATFLVLHNDLEALLAALMIANGSAAQGMRTEIYFAFWGIHLLRGERPRAHEGANRPKPSWLQRALLWLIPRGAKQRLGKLNMGGLGTRILLYLMRKRNILALDQLVEAAARNGVRFRVCTMSMGLMGMTEDDIVEMPNIDFVGVASFAECSARSAVSLVF